MYDYLLIITYTNDSKPSFAHPCTELELISILAQFLDFPGRIHGSSDVSEPRGSEVLEAQIPDIGS